MTQIITGVFGDPATGPAAAAALKKRGFGEDQVRVVAGAGDEGVLASLIGNGLTQAEAAACAGAVSRGGSVVSVAAPFGSANLATHVLNSFDAGKLFSAPVTDADESADPAPFSSIFGWNLLSKGAAPFSGLFDLPVLSKKQSPAVNLLNSAPSPFSRSLGLPTLSRNPAPFSSLFKLPLLSKR